ncbi:hypothetical protein K525DRAFT_192482 [Schizophyllum commune Loenen D]|nr:hypothetical protein K525DRAFT_192482 [Schizophyllum commune Loenen D]
MPGVFGSSIISGSGGLGVPSTLSARVFAKRAVIASRLGMFLYPTGLSRPLSGGCSSLSLSKPSFVSGSPSVLAVSPVGVSTVGGDVIGDAARVVEAFTATESCVDAVVERDALEPVRSANAARRGRPVEGDAVDCCAATLGSTLMRAASWLSDGMRGGAGGFVGGASLLEADIVAARRWRQGAGRDEIQSRKESVSGVRGGRKFESEPHMCGLWCTPSRLSAAGSVLRIASRSLHQHQCALERWSTVYCKNRCALLLSYTPETALIDTRHCAFTPSH